MKRSLQGIVMVGAAGLALAALPRLAFSSDHLDGLNILGDPTSDITDLYSWVDPSANRIVFALNVFPGALPASQFSDGVQYVIHTSSVGAFGGANETAVNIIATFDANQKISVWVGASEYITGDASVETGLSSTDGKVKVFAGRRQDPFFFNLTGFKATAGAIKDAGALAFDDAGCPILAPATATALTTALETAPDGGAPVDTFATASVLSIVVSLDKTLLTTGGTIMSAWASTNKSP